LFEGEMLAVEQNERCHRDQVSGIRDQGSGIRYQEVTGYLKPDTCRVFCLA
jgi:hypothetical protein